MQPTVINRTIFLLLVFLLLRSAPALSQEPLSSRFYFPGLIGINVPSGDEQKSMRSGFTYNTAVEYRPQYVNAVFFRFNYDALSNHYDANPANVPTNIISGKLSSSFLLIGAGYRRKVKRIGFYALAEPGINFSSYDVATNLGQGIQITSRSKNGLAFKVTTGAEFYVVDHFALIFEPAYYHIFSPVKSPVLNPNYVGYNIGFTTTLF